MVYVDALVNCLADQLADEFVLDGVLGIGVRYHLIQRGFEEEAIVIAKS